MQDLKKQVSSIKKEAACWEKAAESGAAKIAQLQDDVDKERRYTNHISTLQLWCKPDALLCEARNLTPCCASP